MYLCAGAGLIGLIAFIWCVRKGKRQTEGIYFLILMISGGLGVLV